MKKKLFVILIMVMSICLLMQSVALAVNVKFGNINLSVLPMGECLMIVDNGVVNMYGDAYCIQIIHESHTDVTYSGHIIRDNTIDGRVPLVTRGDSTMQLQGVMIIMSADNFPCIYGESGSLDILGDGFLEIKAGQGASCIDSIGSLNVNGGTLYVSGDVDGGFKDIECDSFSISGTSSVFLEHGRDGSSIPTTNHKYYEFASASDVPAGFVIPDYWEYPIGAYLNNPPKFTSDATNTHQIIIPGDSLAPLKANDPDGAGDIAEFVVMGGSLPPGITLNNDGSFSGSTNIAHGSYTANIYVKDICGYYDLTTLNIEINNAAPYFSGDAQNTAQSFKVGGSILPVIAHDANGDSDIAGYSITGGTLPAHITIDNSGDFSGVLSVGSYKAIVEVRDAAGLSSTTEIDITVAEATVDIVESSAKLGFSEEMTLTANTDPSGTPISWYSSEPSVATVDVITGKVTAGTTQGTTIISAFTSGGSFDRCIVHVVDDTTAPPASEDPIGSVTLQITDGINPMAGYYVSMFSDPETVVTDSNGIATFNDVVFNTNAPHKLYIYNEGGIFESVFNLYFEKGSSLSTKTTDNNITTTFTDDLAGIQLNLLKGETVTLQSVNLNIKIKQVEKVENPQTGDFEQNSRLIEVMITLVACIMAVLVYLKAQDRLDCTITS